MSQIGKNPRQVKKKNRLLRAIVCRNGDLMNDGRKWVYANFN